MSKIRILIIVLFFLFLLFIPLPYPVLTEVYCKLCTQSDPSKCYCPKSGNIIWGSSLIQSIVDYFTNTQSTSQSTIEVEISPIQSLFPSPIPAQEPILGWKTFIDGYVSFRYPQDWSVEPAETYDSKTITNFFYKLTPLFKYSIIANYNNETGKSFISLDEFLNVRNNKARKITLDNHPAKRVTDPGEEGHVIPYEEVIAFTSNKAHIINLYYSSDYYDGKIEAKQLLDQILSTFKFLDNTNTTVPTLTINDSIEGKFCGGIAANLPENQCPAGYHCQLDGNYPDAGGICVKN